MSTVKYGFTDIYGIAWTDLEVDRYNFISEKIDQRIRDGYKVPEQLLNDRHYQYTQPRYFSGRVLG